MIVEERIYNLVVGKVPEYLRLYEAEALEVHMHHLGRLIGYFTTETGPMHQIVYFWAFDSFEDRARRRAKLLADPAWPPFISKSQPLVRTMENKFLAPTSFSPLR